MQVMKKCSMKPLIIIALAAVMLTGCISLPAPTTDTLTVSESVAQIRVALEAIQADAVAWQLARETKDWQTLVKITVRIADNVARINQLIDGLKDSLSL